MKKLFCEFTKGVGRDNPTLVLFLGLCPTLAVSVSVINALGMGAAATFVLLGSNTIVSCLRKVIPDKIRIPCFVVIIATFVTIAEMLMKAYLPALSKSLGIFIPLIVVNCIVLGRAEAFASRNTLGRSLCDALGMGCGFSLALILISAIREIIGSGKILGLVLCKAYEPAAIMVLAPGALLTMGFLVGFLRLIKSGDSSRRQNTREGCCR